MQRTDEVEVFQQWVSRKIDAYELEKPADANGVQYFQEHFLRFFGEIQREGQRLLDAFPEDQPREARISFAQTLQSISVAALQTLQRRWQH